MKPGMQFDDDMIRIGIKRADKDAFMKKSTPWRPYDIETGREIVIAGLEIVSVIEEPLKIRITTPVFEVNDDPAEEPIIRFAGAKAEEVVPEEEAAPE